MTYSKSSILKRASELAGKCTYHPKFAAALTDGTQTFVSDPCATRFSLTGIVERAALRRSGSGRLISGDPVVMGAVKAILCADLKTVHLDYWEARSKPTQADVIALFARHA